MPVSQIRKSNIQLQTFVQKKKQSIETVQCLRSSAALSLADTRMLLLDFLPSFIIIVQPPLKQVTVNSYLPLNSLEKDG